MVLDLNAPALDITNQGTELDQNPVFESVTADEFNAVESFNGKNSNMTETSNANESANTVLTNTEKLRIYGTGDVPASATAAGTAGDIVWSATHIYVCIATNTWRRVAISSW